MRTQTRPAIASHDTAVALLGLDSLPGTLRNPLEPVHLTVAPDSVSRQRAGLRLHRTHLDTAEITAVAGVPTTSPARTVVDLPRRLPRVPAVALADATLHSGLSTLQELKESVARRRAHKGVRRVREIVSLVRERVGSCPETVLRLILVEAGLPEPEIGPILVDESGVTVCVGDLCYRSLLVWLEYDGFHPRREQRQFSWDRRKDRLLVQRGWHVLRFTEADLAVPTAVVADVRAAWEQSPARIAALDPCRSSEVAAARRTLRLDCA